MGKGEGERKKIVDKILKSKKNPKKKPLKTPIILVEENSKEVRLNKKKTNEIKTNKIKLNK